MNRLRRWLTARRLKRSAISYPLWRETTAELPLIQCRSNRERARLRLLTTLFLHQKRFTGAQQFTITNKVRILIAAQACIPILQLGLDAYAGWIEIIVYPGPFRVRREEIDENGLVHTESRGLSGESWSQGPLILSWQDIAHDSYKVHAGHHVVIHEFAHKLDMQSGRANGMPPLHPDMSLADWSHTLTQAWQQLRQTLASQQYSYLDPYAASSPAEFFAVLSEYFFTTPETLKQHCPGVYHQLHAYYRQHPPTLHECD